MSEDPSSDAGALGPYPAAWTNDVLVGTGESFHMRPIHRDDDERLVAFHQRLSSHSIFRRYFSLHPELSPAEIVHLTQVDYVNRLALVVEDAHQLVGIGRFDRLPATTTAEVAFVVADQFQHRGIGLSLLEHLGDAAWSLGISTFVAETQAANRYMMSVFDDTGFDVHTTIEDEVISVRFPIAPTAASRARRRARLERAGALAPKGPRGPRGPSC